MLSLTNLGRRGRTLAVVTAKDLVMGGGFTGIALAKAPESPATATSIQHLVAIFGKNASFDHYSATDPVATNPAGEPRFEASLGSRQAPDRQCGLGQIGGGSFDAIAGSIESMFDFSLDHGYETGPLILDPSTGEPI